VPAAFDEHTLAMNFFCESKDPDTGDFTGIGFDTFIMNVSGSTVTPDRRINLTGMNLEGCFGGCPPSNDFSGEGFGASFSPDGTELVFTSRADGQGERFAFVADLQSNTIRVLEDSICVGKPDWSSDGEWIAYFGGGSCEGLLLFTFSDLFVIPSESGQSRVLRAFEEVRPRGEFTWREPLMLP